MSENVRRTETKNCYKCKQILCITDFHPRAECRKGIAAICKKCHNNYRTIRKIKNPRKFIEYEFQRGLRRNYGITRKEYYSIYKKQNGCCAICRKHKSKQKRRLAVDHIHDKDKKIRGLLCDNCNPALGYLKDNPLFFKQAMTYLKKFQK